MAFGNKYTVTFGDYQAREHIVYLDLEGYAAGVTALTPSEDPLVWQAGSDRGDVFVTLMPSSVSLSIIVGSSTVFADIAGDGEFDWLLRWTIAGTEVWRGHVLTDELTQPVDIPGELTIRAVCGLVTLDKIPWSPVGSIGEARQTMMPIIANALGDLAHGLSIRSYANWHAENGGAAVTGNSYARDEILPTNYKNTQTGVYASSALVLANLSGLFSATLVQADGKWNLVQREGITGASYTTNVYDSAGAYSTTQVVYRQLLDDTVSPLLGGAQFSAARAYSGAETRYSHGDLGYQLFANPSFQDWTAGVPDEWTEIDEDTGTAPNSGSILGQVETAYLDDTNDAGQTYRVQTIYGASIVSILLGASQCGREGESRTHAECPKHACLGHVAGGYVFG